MPRTQGCCGALHYHAAQESRPGRLRRPTARRLPGPESEVDAIIVNAAGCGAMLKDYGHLLHDCRPAEAVRRQGQGRQRVPDGAGPGQAGASAAHEGDLSRRLPPVPRPADSPAAAATAGDDPRPAARAAERDARSAAAPRGATTSPSRRWPTAWASARRRTSSTPGRRRCSLAMSAACCRSASTCGGNGPNLWVAPPDRRPVGQLQRGDPGGGEGGPELRRRLGPMRANFPTAMVLVLLLGASVAAAEPVDYLRDVKPLLAGRCYVCHGVVAAEGRPAPRHREARCARAATAARPSSPARAARSLLIARVTASGGKKRMPPRRPGRGALREAGGRCCGPGSTRAPPGRPTRSPSPIRADHWAFRAPVRHRRAGGEGDYPGPQSHRRLPGRRAREARPERRSRRPTGPLLLRRVSLDLIGLPPTREELAAFLADTSPDAYEKVVDRLLASPQYGERWGRHWMDVWRYSDWWGLGAEVRNSQKHIWHWRDWIVESLNADKGYDQMVREMLAADELYPNDLGPAARDRLPGPAVLHVQPQHLAGGDGRAHLQGVPRPDDELRQVPRSQVRPDFAAGLLPLPRLLRAVPGAHRRGARRDRLREGRHPARLRLQPRRADVPLRPRRRAAAAEGSAADAGTAAAAGVCRPRHSAGDAAAGGACPGAAAVRAGGSSALGARRRSTRPARRWTAAQKTATDEQGRRPRWSLAEKALAAAEAQPLGPASRGPWRIGASTAAAAVAGRPHTWPELAALAEKQAAPG